MTFFGIVLIIAAIFLVVVVLMQHGKDHNLSGTIAGASETYFGKTKSSTMDKKLSLVTSVVAVIFVVLVLIFSIAFGKDRSSSDTVPATGTPAVTDTAEPDVSGTAADTSEPETTADTASVTSDVTTADTAAVTE